MASCPECSHLAGVMDPEMWFSTSCTRFIKMVLNSYYVTITTIINVGLNDTHSIMGGNWRHLRS